MGAKRTSTIGYERKYNAALQIRDKEEFIASLTTNMPPTPDHFARCSATNGEGPALTRALPTPAAMSPETFAERARNAKALVLDIRGYEAFGGQHVPGAWHIDVSGNFATFAGWVLPVGAEILLVAHDEAEAREATVWLRRVGLDQVTGYLDGGMFAWAKGGLPTEHVAQLSAQELNAMASSQEKVTLVDVRAPREFEAVHIEGAVNIPVPELRSRYRELPKGAPVLLMCSTGHRSSLGASILQRNGIQDVRNVAGGMTGYSAAGFSKECPMCIVPHGPRFLGK